MQNNPNDENNEPVDITDSLDTTPSVINPVEHAPTDGIIEDTLETKPITDADPVVSSPFFNNASGEVPNSTLGTPVVGTSTDPSVANEAPVAMGAPVAPVVPLTPSKKPKKGLIIGLIAAALVVIIGGGSVLAYNFWYQNPEKVVTDALVNTIGARTVQLTGTADIKSEEYTVKVSVDAKSSDVAGEVAVTLDYTAGESTLKFKGAGHFNTEGDLFVKVENVRELVDSFGPALNVDATQFESLIAKVDGNWIKISNKDLGEVSEEYKKTQLCFEDLAKEVKSDKSLSKEVSKLYTKNNFIVIKESLGSRDIKDVDSLGYVVDLDREKAKNFMSGVATTKTGEKLKACDDSIDFNKMAEDIDTTVEDKNTGKVEVWASRFGHQLTEFNAVNSEKGTDSKVVLNPVFNKDLTLEAPTNAISIEELKAEFEKAFEEYAATLSN